MRPTVGGIKQRSVRLSVRLSVPSFRSSKPEHFIAVTTTTLDDQPSGHPRGRIHGGRGRFAAIGAIVC